MGHDARKYLLQTPRLCHGPREARLDPSQLSRTRPRGTLCLAWAAFLSLIVGACLVYGHKYWLTGTARNASVKRVCLSDIRLNRYCP